MTSPSNKEIQIMRLALGLSGIPTNDAGAETVLLVNAEMKRLGADFSLREASEIEYFIQRKYKLNKIVSTEKSKPKKK